MKMATLENLRTQELQTITTLKAINPKVHVDNVVSVEEFVSAYRQVIDYKRVIFFCAGKINLITNIERTNKALLTEASHKMTFADGKSQKCEALTMVWLVY